MNESLVLGARRDTVSGGMEMDEPPAEPAAEMGVDTVDAEAELSFA